MWLSSISFHDHNMLLWQPPLFWEGFPQEFEPLLQGFDPIQLWEQKGWTLMMGGEPLQVRSLCKPVNFQNQKTIFYGLDLFMDHCYVETGELLHKLLPQNWKHTIFWNIIVCCGVKICLHWHLGASLKSMRTSICVFAIIYLPKPHSTKCLK